MGQINFVIQKNSRWCGYMSLMWGSVENTIRPQFFDCDGACQIWEKCALLYFGQNKNNELCDVWEDLFKLQRGNLISTDYYSSFASLIQGLWTYVIYLLSHGVLANLIRAKMICFLCCLLDFERLSSGEVMLGSLLINIWLVTFLMWNINTPYCVVI